MILFRVENVQVPNGLWYRADNQETSNVVHDLALSGAGLPMDFDPEIAAQKWKSAAYSIEQLKYWFNHKDLNKLIPLGYRLYSVDASVVRHHTHELYEHALYLPHTVRNSHEVDINILLEK